MAGKNECLADELAETQKLLKLHKKLLDEAMTAQIVKVNKCKEAGSELLDKAGEQAEYLKRNKQLLDSS